MIGSFRQRHDLPMMTPAAILRSIGRVHSDVAPASFCRFAGQFAEKFCPGRVVNAFCQVMMMHHPVDVQIFNRNDARTIHDLAAFLMGEIVPLELDPFMDTGDGLAMFATFRGPLCQLAMLALDAGKLLFFFPEKARVFNLSPIREGSKGLQSHINAYLIGLFRQSLRATFNRERGVPLASTAFLKSEGFDLPSYGPVHDDLHMTDASKCQLALSIDLETELRVGEAIIAPLPLKAGIAGVLTCFAASEKGLEGQIKPYGNILHYLRVDFQQRGTFLFQQGIGGMLLIERQALAGLLIDFLALCKQVVVEPSAFFQGLIEQRFLFLGWIDPILKHLTHICIIGSSRTTVKHPPCGHSSSCLKLGAFWPLNGKHTTMLGTI